MKNIFALLFFINSVTQVYAVYFSEIMYDPQGSDTSREWVEIYNDTNSAINFTSWKFFENGTNHGITSYSGGASLEVGSYGVIADSPVKFLEDNPSYSDVLYDSAFSLSNNGESFSLKESSSGPEINPMTYDVSLGGNNNGSTLSKIDGVWVRGSSTPGLVNQLSPFIVELVATTTTTNTQATIAQTSPPTANIVLYMPLEKIVVAGAESTFSIFGLTREGKSIDNLNYIWAYGDGGQGVGSTTMYRYAYPGKYIIQTEGSNGYVAGTGRMSVRVVSPELSITKISTGKYGAYIDILNPNNYDLDFSQWKLTIDGATFQFPKNTLIAGNGVTHISGLAMGFASTTISTSTVVKILFPNQEEVTRYTLSQESLPVVVISTSTQVVASLSTTTKISLNSTPVYVKKPAGRVLGVASTTVKNGNASTSVSFVQDKTIKDTRLIAFFKSLFSR